ncbi:hypothetical protein LCGC14_0537010 [marine sediment metagenome]|uniref:Uncharacterized protein n=1 Tax=marine sediment metagenome TaxID=412755 RepID=A0A0F9UFE1_9ZZZZ
MPNKPTDKLTFVEWLAGNEYQGDIKRAKRAIKNVVDYLVDNGAHDGDCPKQIHTCILCFLEQWLSEYHNYFKQK